MADQQRDALQACAEPERRQFDFWIGAWEVQDPGGTLVGHNTIAPLFGGCALREEWRGRSGLQGTSLNTWSARRGVWHQTWIDSSGTLLLLEGGLIDGAMVMQGTTPHPDRPGSVLRHRISWAMVDGDPDHVRQLWETAGEDGSWETAFDGHYHRSAD